MPVGAYQQLSTIADLIVRINPQRTLDIGIGFGTYGVLVREYLDLWDNMNETKAYTWKRNLDGIEILEEYITPMHRFLYDDIHIGDARTVVPTLKKQYDLVILADVIEHLVSFTLLRHLQIGVPTLHQFLNGADIDVAVVEEIVQCGHVFAQKTAILADRVAA